MHVCPCSWALGICKNIGIRTYFGSVRAEFVGVFRHFVFCIKVPKLTTFFIASKNCIFWGTSFEPISNLNFEYRKVTRFSWNPPLYHCYTQTFFLCICCASKTSEYSSLAMTHREVCDNFCVCIFYAYAYFACTCCENPFPWLVWPCVRVALGWLTFVGSLKLYVSFAEYSLFYRALLQKRLVILRSLLIVTTP